jgi:DNA repair exonuclease SbcCD nuclease subunit
MVRFLHTADWQLGMTRHFLDTEAQARFSQARIDAVEAIGRLALDRDCSFVIVCGDVFETNHVERRIIVRALEAMGRTPGVRFFLLPGNHDPINASSIYNSPTFTERCPENVQVLATNDVVEVATETADRTRLVPAPWTSKAPLHDLTQEALEDAGNSEGFTTIVVGHGVVDTLDPDTANPAAIRLDNLEQAIATQHIQYVALGDRHSTTSVGHTGRVWYSGAPEPTNYRETDPGNVLVVAIDGADVSVDPIPVGVWTFHTLDFDLRTSADVDLLGSELAAIENKSVAIVQLKLVGQLSLGDKLRLDSLLDAESDSFASLNTWERHTDLVVLPDDDDLTPLGLAGFARDALDELVDLAGGDSAEATTAQDALGLLYRLAGGGT